MNTAYRILASVTLQHDYYTDGRCHDLEIVPSAATVAALKGAGIRTKMVDNVLLLLVKVNETGKPFITLPQGLKLTFYLQLVNTNFVNFTNIPYQPGDTIFYFTNLYKHKIATTRYLDKPLPAYSNSNSYTIGTMVRDGANNVFEALKPVSNGNHSTNDTNWWYKRAGQHYVHPGDTIVISDGRFEAQVMPARTFDISLFAMDNSTQQYDVPAGIPQHFEFAENQDRLEVDVKGIPPGKYRIMINGQEQYMFIDPAACYQRVSGVIELYNIFPSGSDFGWLDNNGKPKAGDYVIRFANRLVIWKYIVHSEQLTGVEDTDLPNAFTAAAQPLQFVSVNPLPMQQKTVKTIQLMKGSHIAAAKLANPSPLSIGTYTDGSNNTYYCAEMYLNQ